MQSFLQKKASSFVEIEVINPAVEYLLVNCSVMFKPEDNGGYYLNLLNNDISEFLFPATKTKDSIGGIGGKVVPNVLWSYIGNLPYIETVADVKIEQIVRKGPDDYSLGVFKRDEAIMASTPWSVLIPFKQHHIVSTISEKELKPVEIGLGQMEIGLDFILSAEKPEPEAAGANGENKNPPQPKTIQKSNTIMVIKKKNEQS